MKYATLLTFNKKCVHILSLKLKFLKLKERIRNTRLIQELEYVW